MTPVQRWTDHLRGSACQKIRTSHSLENVDQSTTGADSSTQGLAVYWTLAQSSRVRTLPPPARLLPEPSTSSYRKSSPFNPLIVQSRL